MVSFATLQVANLVQATFLLGMNTALSSISIPSILVSPSPILAIRQWHTQFRRAQVPGTVLSASSLILSLILAYGSWDKSGSFTNKTTMLYVTSSVMAFLIFPFTLHYVVPLNDALAQKFREQEEFHYADFPEKDAGMQTAYYHERIAYWGWLNRFRVALYFGVVLVNAVAVLA
ncbi:hypothetical protein COCCADRAFT_90719 [Bipolaris zeicola 26-R-13]|uniref:DUF1772 domain-containing protein n=1 Tax=Cochliobolus carbonum (strain 26-R-13) TaxID=930089 RepID=W6YCY7_COCC2|nr:uncharacterized protein COCCADRAFT_90719 [Bipolaris zeicola 26-R-13]EUC35505.1 hypothetical protein COCCADRAFT_90719 [Bipolaris zeicola 26-R-13]